MRCGRIRTEEELKFLRASDFSCCLSRNPCLSVKAKLVQGFFKGKTEAYTPCHFQKRLIRGFPIELWMWIGECTVSTDITPSAALTPKHFFHR